jgi:hypothetical protein
MRNTLSKFIPTVAATLAFSSASFAKEQELPDLTSTESLTQSAKLPTDTESRIAIKAVSDLSANESAELTRLAVFSLGSLEKNKFISPSDSKLLTDLILGHIDLDAARSSINNLSRAVDHTLLIDNPNFQTKLAIGKQELGIGGGFLIVSLAILGLTLRQIKQAQTALDTGLSSEAERIVVQAKQYMHTTKVLVACGLLTAVLGAYHIHQARNQAAVLKSFSGDISTVVKYLRSAVDNT